MTMVDTVELVTGLLAGNLLDSIDLDIVAVVLDVIEELATMTLVVMEFTLPFVIRLVVPSLASCDRSGGVTGE